MTFGVILRIIAIWPDGYATIGPVNVHLMAGHYVQRNTNNDF